MDKVQWDEQYTKLLAGDLPKGLIRRCVRSIALNDEAHNLDHVLEVCKLAKKLCYENKLNPIDRQIILAGALMHDLGCRYDRATHHFISYGMALAWIDLEAYYLFDDQHAYLVARACLEHRASYTGEFTSFHSEYVALADRGVPDIGRYIERAVLFRKDSGLELSVFKEEVYKHLIEKFAPVEGYVWKNYPKLGLELFQSEWKTFHEVLLNSKQCLDLIEQKHTLLIT